MNRRPWFYPALSLMLWLAGSLMAGAIILWPAAAHDEAAVETAIAALQAQMGAATQAMVDLQGELAVQGDRIGVLEAAPAAEIAWPRHMMFRLDPLSDPYEVACQTTVDQAVRCDPTEKVRQLDEDPKLWDNGVCLNGTLAMVAEVPTYTPPAGFDGPDACTADVSDGGGYAIETKVTVTVSAP